MKQIIVAFSLLGAITLLVTWNALHLTSLCGDLLTMCNDLPETREAFESVSVDEAEEILRVFKSHTFSMNLSLPFPEIRETERALTDVISYIRVRNYEEYIAARERSILALRVLRDYEIPHLDHLL